MFCATEQIAGGCTNLADPSCSQLKDERLFNYPHVVDWWTLHHIFFPFLFVIHGVKWEHAMLLVYVWKAQECAFSEFANIKDALLVDPLEALLGIMVAHLIVSYYGAIEKTVKEKVWYILGVFIIGYSGTQLVWHRTILGENFPDEILFMWPTASIMLLTNVLFRPYGWRVITGYVAGLYVVTFLSARPWWCGEHTTLNTFHLQILAHLVLFGGLALMASNIPEKIQQFRHRPSVIIPTFHGSSEKTSTHTSAQRRGSIAPHNSPTKPQPEQVTVEDTQEGWMMKERPSSMRDLEVGLPSYDRSH